MHTSMPCHPRHTTPRHATLRRAAPRRTTPRHATPHMHQVPHTCSHAHHTCHTRVSDLFTIGRGIHHESVAIQHYSVSSRIRHVACEGGTYYFTQKKKSTTQARMQACHTMPRRAMPRRAMPRRAMPRRATPHMHAPSTTHMQPRAPHMPRTCFRSQEERNPSRVSGNPTLLRLIRDHTSGV